jgi:hypothetical protein
MKKRVLMFLSFSVAIALLLGACATTPRQVGYQAVLTGPGGIPVANGNYTVTVKFWDSLTATAPADLIYQDDQTVAVTNGIFNIAIPDQVSEANLLDPADFARPLWVELTINGETLSPRQKLLGTPYALNLVSGAVVALSAGQEAPLVAGAPERGVLTIVNQFASDAVGSPGATGLVVAILDKTDSDLIRACAGSTSCQSADVVFRVRGNGDVSQSVTGNGLVKAVVYATCSTVASSILRSFNNVTGGAVTIANGAAAGRCTLDFGFNISSRYWVATAVGNSPRFVACIPNGASNNKLDCYRFNEAGNGASGNIMVTLY